MNKFIVIGGEEIRNYDRNIDAFALNHLEGVYDRKPRVLLLPQASAESKPFVNTFYKIYGKLKSKASCVLFKNNEMSYEHIAEKFDSSDIIYIGGGNFGRLLAEGKKMNFAKLLKRASDCGKPIVGNSAGALYLFSHGISDYLIDENGNGSLAEVEGLGLIDAVFTPHANDKREQLATSLADKYRLPCFALKPQEALCLWVENKQVVKVEQISKSL